MGTMTKTVQQRIERFQQKKVKHNELTQPGLDDEEDYVRQQYKKYGKSELNIPAVVQP